MATAVGTYVTATLVKERTDIPDTDDDTLLGKIVDEVNQYIETMTGRVIAPQDSQTWLFDGRSDVELGGRILLVPRGVRTVTTLSIADYTGDTFTTVTSGDYFPRPAVQNRKPGWPATYIEFSDRPTGAYSCFPTSGIANIKLVGDVNFEAIPDDIRQVAVVTAVRAWHARQSGMADIVGNDETGAPIISRYVSVEDKHTLADYALTPMTLMGAVRRPTPQFSRHAIR